MYNDQLDFNRNKSNEFILIDNSKEGNREENYINNINKEKFVINSLESYKKDQRYDLPEQLDYLLQPSYNYYPQEKPNPLIYNANSAAKKSMNGNKKNKSLKSKINSFSGKKIKVPNKSKPNKNGIKSNININVNINHNIPNNNSTNNNNKNFVFSSNGNGLFDPRLKKNELGINKRNETIKQERLEKIKNYNVKFGKKVENLEMYSNINDMIEGKYKFKKDVSNQKIQRQFQKTEIKKKNDKNNINLEPERIRYISNNLDFNFDKQEEMVKALEKQIENERKLRAEMNMKLIRKAKELEEMKYQNIVKENTEGARLSRKVKSTIRTYITGNSKNKFKIINNHYKNELNRTINQVKSTIPKAKIQRSNSALNVNKRIKQMEPNIDRYVEESLNKLYKNILKSYEKNLDKRSLSTVKKNIKSQLLSSLKTKGITKNTENDDEKSIKVRSDRQDKVNESYNINGNKIASNEISSNKNVDIQNVKSINEEIKNNSSLYNRAKSFVTDKPINNDENFLIASPASFKNDDLLSNKNMIMSTNNNNSIQKFSGNANMSYNSLTSLNNVEKKMLEDMAQNQIGSGKLNKFDIIKTINKEIDSYNKGLPQLISKVENTLDKINQNEILDKKLHPVIKLVSKTCGKQIFFHIDEITEKIIDDLLIECVEYLEEIDKIGKKQKEIEKFSIFLSKYSNNFEFIKNFELDLARKLNENAYPNLNENKVNPVNIPIHLQEDNKFARPNMTEMLIFQNQEMKNYKEENLELKSNYKSPFSLEIEKIDGMRKRDYSDNLEYLNDKHNSEYFEKNRKYRVCLNPKIIFETQKYVERYKDFQKTTGVYFRDNIFTLYDELVEELVKELMEEEIDRCMNDIDNFAEELYIKEIQENNL